MGSAESVLDGTETELDLSDRDNKLGPSGCQALATHLENNSTLTLLRVSSMFCPSDTDAYADPLGSTVVHKDPGFCFFY